MPTATATEPSPSHHVTLSDGTTTFGFVLVDGQGEINERAITRTSIPPTGTKITQGSTKYADLEFPLVSIAQDDWSSGRGGENFEDDRTRFADSYRLVSRHQSTLMLGPREIYTQGYRDDNQYLPVKTGVTWQSLTGSNRYVAYKFTTTAAYNALRMQVWIRRRGSPGTLTCELRDDNSGDPGSVLKTDTATTSDVTDTISVLYRFAISSQALSNATAYWVVIYGAAGDTSASHWEVGTDAADTNNLTKSSTAGSSWANASYDLYFRVRDDNADKGGRFFEYKGSLYCVKNTDTGTPRLYINGTRGLVLGASQSTTTLGDSAQSWTTDEHKDSVVVLWEGAGSNTGKYFGTITGNTATVLTFDAITNTPVADDTTYSIVARPEPTGAWSLISGHGLTGPITDVAVFGDYVYFAQGQSILIRSMRQIQRIGSLAYAYANSNTAANFLQVVHDPQKGSRIWSAVDRDSQGRRSVSSSKEEAGALFFALTIEDAEDVWTAGSNTVVTSDDTDYVAGSASVKIVATSAGAAEILAYETITSLSLFAFRTIQWWFKSSIELDAGDLDLRISIASDATSSVKDFPFPEVEADVWTEVTLPFDPNTKDYRKITSIGVEQVTNLADFTLRIDAVIVSPGAEFGDYVQLPKGFGRLTGLEAYGEPEELWVFREGQAGRITNGVFTPLPLREMSNARSRTNGKASTVNGVYLYFSYLQGLQRYYRNNLDDTGPDGDEGLPDNRRGSIGRLLSYPGRIFASIDTDATRYSTILSYNRRGWHEYYRSPEIDQNIDAMYIQTIPGITQDRLWMIQGEDILWLPLPGQTLREDTDTTFIFTHEGTLESGWMSANLRDMEKFYNSLKIITLDTNSGAQIVEADYRTDESATWVVLPSTFGAFRTEVDLTSTTPPNVTGRRLRYRLRLQSNGPFLSPKVKAVVLEAVARVPIKYTDTMAFIAQDLNKDIESRLDSYAATETVVSQLDTWASSATVLVMRSVYSPYDNKEVLLDPASLRPTYVDMGNQQEGHTGQLTVVEI